MLYLFEPAMNCAQTSALHRGNPKASISTICTTKEVLGGLLWD